MCKSVDPQKTRSENKVIILIVDDEKRARRDLERVVKSVVSDVEIFQAEGAKECLEIVTERHFDVIFLDINMPGMEGITLAGEIKKLRPLTNIVFVTAYPQYALDAHQLFVSGYLLKPALPDDVKNVLANLRHPVETKKEGLFIKCFGNFDVFYNGENIHFGRQKAKEMLAYLIDRRGASATNAEIRSILWGDNVSDDDSQKKYFSQIVFSLRETLRSIGEENILVQSRDSYSVQTDLINCDYYNALDHDNQALSSYEGEYMSQYEWAEGRVGFVN